MTTLQASCFHARAHSPSSKPGRDRTISSDTAGRREPRGQTLLQRQTASNRTSLRIPAAKLKQLTGFIRPVKASSEKSTVCDLNGRGAEGLLLSADHNLFE